MDQPTPSKQELEILKLCWREGELSAREAHDALGERLGWTLSTTRTTLDRMEAKGLLKTRSVHRLKVYDAGVEKTSTLAAMVGGFVRRVLEIDGPVPVASFAESKILDPDELAELEAFLEQTDKGEGDAS
ncbi:MAG: BlaI/MecI/CopY family transcriptional regulator [Pseudomonadota bacterium]